MSAVSLAVASAQGLLGTPSLLTSDSVPTISALWMSEAISSIVGPDNAHATSTSESPVFSAVTPTAALHPLQFIPAIPNVSPDSPTSIQVQSTEIFTLTVTETLTVFVSATSPAHPSPSPDAGVSTAEWKAPSKMDDLSAFKISAFSGGKQNLEVVQGIPPIITAAITTSDSNSPSTSPETAAWDDEGSVLQLLYPAGSINPAQRPVGGAQFYAAPLNLTGARNVSLEYSAFFPADFDWVLGGKMPGLYGGHAGCSGGNEALDCWSTRLMWRSEGKGELYLYAPKDKQTEELCGDPHSVCDATYGFSVGRGSFEWTPGAWTTVRQTVVLNTPGEQDGCFNLDVNGKRVIERSDIFYRDLASPTKPHHSTTTTTKDKGGGLGGLLGTLLSGLLQRDAGPTPTAAPDGVVQPLYQAQHGWAIQVPSTAVGISEPTPFTAHDPQPTPPPSLLTDNDGDGDGNDDETMSIESKGEPVGFKGLFFSSFFGGHTPRYATPTDQYTWFKDFSMTYNA